MNKFPRLTYAVILLTTTMIFGSCSSIINGSKQNISIRANPLEAEIYIDGELAGSGTASVKLQRGKDHVIEAKMDGYRTAKLTTDKSLTGWFWGNCILGGAIGMVIDLITGSAYDVDPEHVVMNLERNKACIEKRANELLGEVKVISPLCECLATINISWE